MEASAILGLISSVLSIIEATKQVYDAANSKTGLPEAFEAVATRLPIVLDILGKIKAHASEVTDPEERRAITALLKACEDRSEQLRKIFEKVIPAKDANRSQRYLAAVRSLRRGRQALVESLMEAILADLHTIGLDLGFSRQADILQAVSQAKDYLSQLEPSISPEEISDSEPATTNYNNYGDGPQNAFNGSNNTNYGNRGNAQHFSPGAFSPGANYYAGTPSESNSYASEFLGLDPRISHPTEDLNRLKDRADPTPTTCDWFKTTTEYMSWCDSDERFSMLAVTGAPGSGKTCISISWANELKHAPQQAKGIHAYYFCDANVKTRSTGTVILRGLLHQLCDPHSSDPTRLWSRQALDVCKNIKESGESDWRREFDQLWTLFEAIISDPKCPRVNILVDAIDEYSEEPGRLFLERLARIQRDLGRTVPRGKVRVLLTLRSEGNLRKTCPRYRFELLRLEAGRLNQLLTVYIEQSISDLFNAATFPDDLIKSTVRYLRDRAENTFLWVSFLISDLKAICEDGEDTRTNKIVRVKAKLRTVPQGLEAYYDQIVGNLERGSLQDVSVSRFLHVLAAAARPLTKEEIWQACQLHQMPWDHLSFPQDSERNLLEEAYVYRVCLNLVHVYEPVPGKETVSLVHQSLQEYLLQLDERFARTVWSYLSRYVLPGQWSLRIFRFYCLYTGHLPSFDLTPEWTLIHSRLAWDVIYFAGLGIAWFMTIFHTRWQRKIDITREWLLSTPFKMPDQVAQFLWVAECVSSLIRLTNMVFPTAWRLLLMGYFWPLLFLELNHRVNKQNAVSRQRAQNLMWQVCAKRMILFLDGSEGSPESSLLDTDAHDNAVVLGQTDTAVNVDDNLLGYAMEHICFHAVTKTWLSLFVKALSGDDPREQRELRELLDRFPSFRQWWLNIACHRGDHYLVKKILMSGGKRCEKSILNPFHTGCRLYTPIECAMDSGDFAKNLVVITMLVRRGANLGTEQGNSATNALENWEFSMCLTAAHEILCDENVQSLYKDPILASLSGRHTAQELAAIKMDWPAAWLDGPIDNASKEMVERELAGRIWRGMAFYLSATEGNLSLERKFTVKWRGVTTRVGYSGKKRGLVT